MSLALDYVKTILEYDSPLKDYRLVRLVCATQQLVSGMLYKLDVQVADENDEDLQNCSFKILEPFGASQKSMVEIACDGKSPWKIDSKNTNVSTLDVMCFTYFEIYLYK